MIKHWKVTAEINQRANNYSTITISANTERKARIIAQTKFKKLYFFAHIVSVEQVNKKEGESK